MLTVSYSLKLHKVSIYPHAHIQAIIANDSDVVCEQFIEKLIQPSFSQESITAASLDRKIHVLNSNDLTLLCDKIFFILHLMIPFYEATVPIECDFYFPMETFIITEHIVLYGLNIFKLLMYFCTIYCSKTVLVKLNYLKVKLCWFT